MLKTAAIVPVKRFGAAKTRLDLPRPAKVKLCMLMLCEVLETLSHCRSISETIVVTGDRTAMRIAESAGAHTIQDDTESGVNEAVLSACAYVQDRFDATLVLPQDVPFTTVEDLEFLFRLQAPPSFVIVVPSRRFDGTNALVRMPHNIIATSYDENSYRNHTRLAKNATRNLATLHIENIMADIDSIGDVRYCLGLGSKPALREEIAGLAGLRP